MDTFIIQQDDLGVSLFENECTFEIMNAGRKLITFHAEYNHGSGEKKFVQLCFTREAFSSFVDACVKFNEKNNVKTA
jgi:hypothetical protein